MTGREAVKLWELYPDVRNLYEEYNGILLGDDVAWKELTEKAEATLKELGCSELKQQLILFPVAELEIIAKTNFNKVFGTN